MQTADWRQEEVVTNYQINQLLVWAFSLLLACTCSHCQIYHLEYSKVPFAVFNNCIYVWYCYVQKL